MNDADALDVLIRQRLEALVRDLPSARAGDIEALHRTRVASRRMREALPFVDLTSHAVKTGRVRRTARGLTRALGRVRELDVALGILSECSTGTPARRRVVERVRARVEQRRETLRRAMLRTLEKLAPERLVAELVSSLAAGDTGATTAWRARLADQLVRRGGALQRAVGEAGVLFVSERLHAVRIALKKLRYAVEVVNETDVARTRGTLKTLKRGQDQLGRLHDLNIVGALVASVRDDAPPGETTVELDALLQDLDTESRQLHGGFVASRARIDTLCRAMPSLAAAIRHPSPDSPATPSPACEGPGGPAGC